MAKIMRGCLTTWSQPDGTVELVKIASILQLVEQELAKDEKDVVDCEPDVDYKPEGLGPSNEPVT